MRQIYKPLIIFSVFQAEKSYFNNESDSLTIARVLKANNINYKLAEGFYKGVGETCFIVQNSLGNYPLIMQIARNFKQESILLRHADGTAELEYLDGRREFLGEFVKVSAEIAENRDSYTITEDGYYITRGA